MSTGKNVEKPARVTFKNIKKFIQGNIRMFTDEFGLLPRYKKEQVLWRTQKAEECSKLGYCIFCGCDTPDKYYADEACEDPVRQCYPDMMDKDEWKRFKVENKVSVQADFKAEPYDRDLGTINDGAIVVLNSEAENTSSEDITVEPWAACGCTSVSADKHVVKPGEKVTIKGSFNTEGRKGDNLKSYGFTYKDPEDGSDRRVTFTFKVNVI